MYYFVPAWYATNRPWYAASQEWTRVYEEIAFDDTINQVQLFAEAGEAVRLIFLTYQPQLRYELHEKGLLGQVYWSFFDDIQNISRTHTRPIDFTALAWPKGTEFLYTPFAVFAKKDGVLLAKIAFASSGNLLEIQWQKEGQPQYTYLFDDRGFLSSILYYDGAGQALYQDYLNENGVWQVREHLQATEEPAIEINWFSDHVFAKKHYADWGELVQERLALLAKQVLTDQDTLVLASHALHNQMLLDSFPQQKRVLSFFGQRYSLENKEALVELVKQVDLLVTESKDHGKLLEEALKEAGSPSRGLLVISPFDSRLRLGQSQSMRFQDLYFRVDGLSTKEVKEHLIGLFPLLAKREDLLLTLVTYERWKSFEDLKAWMESYLLAHFDREDFFMESLAPGENPVDEPSWELSRMRFINLVRTDQIIQELDQARLVIDLAPQPDLYTQIASLSAGLPQIHQSPTDYVRHKENGWLLSEEGTLEEAVAYYVNSLSHWNKALVHTVERMAENSSGRLLAQWRELLERNLS
ncbi:accessory Sec system protein Asp1 [Streptococcus sp. DD12]|uniref:accessory Sec system protein Asp1 n=1 Tax=Streptococcus sp. DD12 TaxID=1777880 RepID=UPI000794A252|nr:accessory Sec system protein Asp1 [Streptococcus sp. DD12]KXT76464.1 Accessory secretory protein Asp1 [Streptococcus sp. DD12]